MRGLPLLTAFALGGAMVWLCMERRDNRLSTHPITPQVVVVHDTLHIASPPTPLTSRVVDTLATHDTLLPITQHTYGDSSYTAWVSGYAPRLDSIALYPSYTLERVVTPAPPHRWSVGVTAGYGFTPYGATPYVGVGISYALFSW